MANNTKKNTKSIVEETKEEVITENQPIVEETKEDTKKKEVKKLKKFGGLIIL